MAIPSVIIANRSTRAQAPGPRGQFMLGSLQDFRHNRLSFVLRVAKDYGPIARYSLAGNYLNQVNHPDAVQRVLQENNHNYIKGVHFNPIRLVGGEGLFTSEGEHWLRQRRLIQPVFHRQRLAGFAEVMTSQTVQMLERWDQLAREDISIDISREFTELTMRVIAEVMFSTRIEGDVRAVGDAITVLLADIDFRLQIPFYPGLNIPTPRNRRALSALRLLDETIFRIITTRRQSQEQKNDLLGMLMEARDEDTGEAMSDKHLRDEVVTMFVAGHETTALLLTWLFHILSHQPEWEGRLVDEVDQALQGRLPTFADLPRFPLLRMAIDETLRLYPPVWATNRTCVQDDELCGYRIRAGEAVLVPPYVVHRLPEFWPDPEKFDPFRFTPENSAGRPRFAYFPFGGGPRQCIGNNFALMEAQLVFAAVVQRFRMRAMSKRHVQIAATATLRPEDGIIMRLQKR